MRLAIIESPFHGKDEDERQRNEEYLIACIADSLKRGEAPIASHKMYPGALDEMIPEERDLGIRAGFAWWKHADVIAFYVDYGMSPGMHKALQRAKTMQMRVEERKL